MWDVWDIGANFIVLIPAEDFQAGWTDAGHADLLDDAREIAADYEGSRIFQRDGETWTEIEPDVMSIAGAALVSSAARTGER